MVAVLGCIDAKTQEPSHVVPILCACRFLNSMVEKRAKKTSYGTVMTIGGLFHAEK